MICPKCKTNIIEDIYNNIDKCSRCGLIICEEIDTMVPLKKVIGILKNNSDIFTSKEALATTITELKEEL